MILLEFLEVSELFRDFVCVEYLCHALIMPSPKRNGISSPYPSSCHYSPKCLVLRSSKTVIHKRVTEPPIGKGVEPMPKLLSARVPENTEEERKIRKLAGSRHAPGDWIFRARIISLSWQGLRTARIAEQLGSHTKTVRK